MVALVFVTMIGFVIDTGLRFYTQSIMDDAARTAAHNSKTGNLVAASSTSIGASRSSITDVTTTVCNLLLFATASCDTTTLQVYAAADSSFSKLQRADAPGSGLSKHGAANFNAGDSSQHQYVLLQVAFRRWSIVPFIGLTEPYVVSTVMYKNEL